MSSLQQRWLERRLPAAPVVRLGRKQIFVFPSKAGAGFLLLGLLLWMLGVNYQSNPVLAISFLLFAIFFTAILHSFINLAGLKILFTKANPVFAGTEGQFVFTLVSGVRQRTGVHLRFAKNDRVQVDLLPQHELAVSVPYRNTQRGWCTPDRLIIESYYPLGLFRVWTLLDLQARILVYPKPMDGSLKLTGSSELEEGIASMEIGVDDFLGFEDYRPEHGLHQVAWKQFARTGKLYNKQYASVLGSTRFLDWDDYPGMDREGRLSRLCSAALQLSSNNATFGLQLPGTKIQPGSGDQHLQNILKTLALFEWKGPGRGD